MSKHSTDPDSGQHGQYLTTEVAAQRLSYTPQHVCRLIRSGKLAGWKVGRDWLVTQASVDAHLVARDNYALLIRNDEPPEPTVPGNPRPLSPSSASKTS